MAIIGESSGFYIFFNAMNVHSSNGLGPLKMTLLIEIAADLSEVIAAIYFDIFKSL